MKKSIRKNRKSIFETLLGGLLGLSFFTLTTYPKSIVNKKIPTQRIKHFQFAPSLKYQSKDRLYHFHHWLIFSSLYVTLAALRRSTLKNKLFHGFLIGSILQGLLYADRFKIIHKLEETVEERENPSKITAN